MSIPFDVTSDYWKKAHHGMNKRIRHRVVLVRHGESTCNLSLMTTGKKTDEKTDPPVLTDIGHQQSREIAQYLKKTGLNFTDVEVSPQIRAWETAIPTIDILNNVNVSIHSNLREKWRREGYHCKLPKMGKGIWLSGDMKVNNNTWFRPSDTQDSFNKRIHKLRDRFKSIGTVKDRRHTLVFTHSQVISQLVSDQCYFHISNGSITVLDFDENDRMHVHFVNHTEHLSKCSGHHTIYQETH
jgi:broad specificity phosphatase PhoE